MSKSDWVDVITCFCGLLIVLFSVVHVLLRNGSR